jgi:outer membrane immunogenic protein
MLHSRIAIAAVCLALSAPANAQERPALWDGLYFGAFAAKVDAKRTGNLIYTDENTGVEYDHMGSKQSLDYDGYQGGIEVGYNWQINSLVMGVAGDVSFGDMSTHREFLNGAYKWDIESQLNAIATLRGKLGVSLGPVLVYGTGGIALAGFHSDKEVTSNDNADKKWVTTALDSANDSYVGFIYGAGAEWMIWQGLSVKAEWLRVELGKEEGVFEGTAYPNTPNEFAYDDDRFRADGTIDIIRAGMNYRF